MIISPLPNPLPGGEGIKQRTCPGFFITGTDTGVGKTRITLGVMRALQQQGLRATGMKPVASGCAMTAEGLRNEDALLLQQYASAHHPYDIINPYAFAPAIAPHLAATQAGMRIELALIIERFNQLVVTADAIVVEGAGGWRVPLNDTQSIADLAVALGLPVLLVVDIRLGCINHALLTAEAIRASGCLLAGWVANHVTAAATNSAEVIHAITTRIAAPLLGELGYQEALDVEQIANALDGAALKLACER